MNIYDILSRKPHSERHLARYVKFIQSRQLQDGPLERHHICPKASDLFPQYSSLKEHPWNRIDLTPREHYIAHLLLWKVYGGSQSRAYVFMSSKSGKNSYLYEKAKLDRFHTEETKAKIGKSHLGMKRSNESRAKMSLAGKGKTKSIEHRSKIAAALKGRKMNDTQKLAISNTMKERNLV